MELIGQFDSPFVRRVALAMSFMGLSYDHHPWSVFGDADKIARYSSLLRVPVLVLDDGQVLTESWAIIEFLEGASEASLWPRERGSRTSALGLTAVATGLADKAVSLVYERVIRDVPSDLWVARCHRQISAAADQLDSSRSASRDTYLFGDEITHADIAVAAVWRFLSEAHQAEFDLARWPALRAHSEQCEAVPEFRAVQQRFYVSR
jgi:glutathione S-transferase